MIMHDKKYLTLIAALFISITLITCTNNPGVTDIVQRTIRM
jgi:hypothetical protein